MNVLVYAGSEVNQASLQNATTLLRSISLPNYTVQPLARASFLKEPWEVGCRLLVLPFVTVGGANQTRPLEIFGPSEVRRIRKFVEQDGGSVLAIGVGVRQESSSVGFLANATLGLRIGGPNIKAEDIREPLQLQDKASNTSYFPEIHTDVFETGVDLGSGNTFPETQTTVAEIVADAAALAHDTSSPPKPTALVVSVGKGRAAFVRPTLVTASPQALESLVPLFHSTLTDLGLSVPSLSSSLPIASASSASGAPKSLPQFLTSVPSVNPTDTPKPIVSAIRQALFPSEDSRQTIRDTADTFDFVPLDSGEAKNALDEAHKHTEEGPEKIVIVCPDGVLPAKELTPKFDFTLYYESLLKVKASGIPVPVSDDEKPTWAIGEALLYGERVTSTQSLLDRNPQLLASLPTPILSLASQQISGRGRGKNVWLSPEGCLMFSLLLRIELDPGGSQSSNSSLKGQSKTGKIATTSDAKTSATGPKTTQSVSQLKSSDTSSPGAGPETAPNPLKTQNTLKTEEDSSAGASPSNLKSQATGPSLKSSVSGLKSTTTEGGASLKSTLGFSPNLAMGYSFSSAYKPPPALPRLASSRLVFIQYLFAMAVAEACRLPEVLGPKLGKRVRLKWPNDIYLDLSEEGVGDVPKDWSVLKKIGGVLVNTNFAPGGRVELVIGCGLNVLNEPPITSLAQLKARFGGEQESETKLSLEATAAAIMASFERMWSRFVNDRGSFAAFEAPYLHLWLHTDQRVMLTTVDPPLAVRIVGITPDYGLLRTIPDRQIHGAGVGSVGLGLHLPRYVYPGGDKKEYVDLQPDGNSFDLMAGLIKAKTT